MGCGASAATHPTAVGKEKGLSNHSSSTAYVNNVDVDLSEDDHPITADELKLIAEIDARSTCSTAVSASEPGEFATSVRIGMRVAKARLLYGIDGTCEEVKSKEAEDQASPRLKREGSLQDFGELKPRQVKKIQEWVERTRLASSGRYSPVPERYLFQKTSSSLRGTDPSDTPNRWQTEDTPRTIESVLSPHGDQMSVSDWNAERQQLPGAIFEDDDDEIVLPVHDSARVPAQM